MVRQPRQRRPVVVLQYFGTVTLPPRVKRGDGSGAKSAEWFPHHIVPVG